MQMKYDVINALDITNHNLLDQRQYDKTCFSQLSGKTENERERELYLPERVHFSTELLQ